MRAAAVRQKSVVDGCAEGPTDEPVHFIFLLLTPEQNYRGYIPILAQIATLMRGDSTRREMLAAQTPSEITAILKRLPAS